MSKEDDLLLLKEGKKQFAEDIGNLIRCGKFSVAKCAAGLDNTLLQAFGFIKAADYSDTTGNDEQLASNVQATNTLLNSLKQ